MDRKQVADKLIDSYLAGQKCSLCVDLKRGVIKHSRNFYQHMQSFHSNEVAKCEEECRVQSELKQSKLAVVRKATVLENLVMYAATTRESSRT